ncbi:hypothetical protein HGRIS_010922 [Hohenbuehelia grisea]
MSSRTGSFVSASTVSINEIKDGRAWAMAETFRSLCLQGMSHERLSPTLPRIALKSYASALPLLSIFESEIATLTSASRPSTTPAGKLDFAYFKQFQELWRWVEQLIWRGIVLCARICDLHHSKEALDENGDSIWTWFQHYRACSLYWPPTFRTEHRHLILALHLRALILLHSSSSASQPSSPDDSSHTRTIRSLDSGPAQDPIKPPPWLHTARLVVQELRGILSASTRFPRAGERNTKVEDFVDLCVCVWEASGALGEYTGWVIDVLWWATRLTFNSYRIFRHMTRLLYASGDISLAKRTLKLYTQVVGKAYETLMTDEANKESAEAPNGNDASSLISQTTNPSLHPDADAHAKWVETLVQGARLLCKSSSLSGNTDDLKEAGITIEKAKSRLAKTDDEHHAAVSLAEGIWKSCSALRSHDPAIRERDLDASHKSLQESFATHASAATAYHLAILLARPGQRQNLDEAIKYIAHAMELEPSEVRYWHLMALLLSATEQWKAALAILEQGAAIGEALQEGEFHDNEETEVSNTETATMPSLDTVRSPQADMQVKDFADVQTDSATRLSLSLPPPIDGLPSNSELSQHAGDGNNPRNPPPPSSLRLLDGDARFIPSSSALLLPMCDHPRPSTHEQFEYALQLRMTQVAVIEYVEGAEAAGDKWLEVFAWIAEKRGIVAQQTRPSMDGGRPPEKGLLLSPSLQENGVDLEGDQGQLSPVASGTHEHPPSIPINVQPATPEAQFETFAAADEYNSENASILNTDENEKGDGAHRRQMPKLHVAKRSHSIDRDLSKRSAKRMQAFVKNGVHKGQVTITTISKKIGNGVVKNGSMRRSTSTPDFHSALRPSSYQASSIHSRRRITSIVYSFDDDSATNSPPPPPVPLPNTDRALKTNSRTQKENRLLSDLWLMSAATFRRLGKIEQAKGAIQEAEVRDEDNPHVWVQLGLYYTALGHRRHAIDAFHKALFIIPDDVQASIHLCRLYLTSDGRSANRRVEDGIPPDDVDLAAGILSDLTKGRGWDVPEAWYYLAKAYGLQGRKQCERECLATALRLSERRTIRDISSALGPSL